MLSVNNVALSGVVAVPGTFGQFMPLSEWNRLQAAKQAASHAPPPSPVPPPGPPRPLPSSTPPTTLNVGRAPSASSSASPAPAAPSGPASADRSVSGGPQLTPITPAPTLAPKAGGWLAWVKAHEWQLALALALLVALYLLSRHR